MVETSDGWSICNSLIFYVYQWLNWEKKIELDSWLEKLMFRCWISIIGRKNYFKPDNKGTGFIRMYLYFLIYILGSDLVKCFTLYVCISG